MKLRRRKPGGKPVSSDTRERFNDLVTGFISDSQEAREEEGNRKSFMHFPRLTRRRFALLLPLLIFTSLVIEQGLYESFGPGSCHAGGGLAELPHRVGLIDTLANSNPDKEFIQSVQSVSEGSGRTFRYFTSDTLSLDSFVNLPLGGYSILILRTHAGYSNVTTSHLEVAIATSEPYDNYRHVSDQLWDQVAEVKIDGSFYFGLTPLFVSQRLCGTFPRTVILAMGCYTMDSNDLGRAFVSKGASAFVGWKGIVHEGETDIAFSRLIPLLLADTSVDVAVHQVMQSMGHYPSQPVLSYYSGQ